MNIYTSRIIASLYILMSLLCACMKSGIAPSEYQDYIISKENGLFHEYIVPGAKIEFLMEPTDWTAFRYSMEDGVYDNGRFEDFKKQNEGVLHFVMKLYLDSASSLKEYYEMNYDNFEEAALYTEYGIKSDFSLWVDSSAHYEAYAVHHQPSFGIKPYEEFIIMFHTDYPNLLSHRLDIRYTDQLWGVGTVDFSFSENHVKDIPKLKLN